MDWDKLKIFHAVAEAGNFTKSTYILNLSQSAISKKRKDFIWKEIPKLIDFATLEKSIKVVGLDELLSIFPSMLEGKLKNKILVDVNK